jgi:hypothetical protein
LLDRAFFVTLDGPKTHDNSVEKHFHEGSAETADRIPRDDKGEGNRSIESGCQTVPSSSPQAHDFSCSLLGTSVRHRTPARPMMQIRKRVDRGSRISVAKAESLGKFLLVFIKVDQVSVIFGILAVYPKHREVRCADDCDDAHHMPQTGL